jgi:hypothetical protein
MNRIFKILETGFLSNLMAGVIVGLLGRLAMTAITQSGGFSLEFPRNTLTLAGTIRIIATPLLFGLPVAWFITAVQPYLPGGVWLKSLLSGLMTFVFPGLLLMTDSEFKISAANRELGRPVFTLIYFLYGFFLARAVALLNKRMITNTMWLKWRRVILPLSFVGLLVVFEWSDSLTFER